jgi:hypothetical protein
MPNHHDLTGDQEIPIRGQHRLTLARHPHIHVAHLEDELTHLEKKRYKNEYLKAEAQWHIKGESINKYWSKTNKLKKLRDPMDRIADPLMNKTTTNSSKMADIA